MLRGCDTAPVETEERQSAAKSVSLFVVAFFCFCCEAGLFCCCCCRPRRGLTRSVRHLLTRARAFVVPLWRGGGVRHVCVFFCGAHVCCGALVLLLLLWRHQYGHDASTACNSVVLFNAAVGLVESIQSLVLYLRQGSVWPASDGFRVSGWTKRSMRQARTEPTDTRSSPSGVWNGTWDPLTPFQRTSSQRILETARKDSAPRR